MTSIDQDAFVKMASSHIDLANSHDEGVNRELVAVALTHAAARYNAFMISTALESKLDLLGARDEAIAFHVAQFREFLEQHYDGYVAEAKG